MTTVLSSNGEVGHPCPECNEGVCVQCDVTGDWVCDNCDYWMDGEDYAEAMEDV